MKCVSAQSLCWGCTTTSNFNICTFHCVLVISGLRLIRSRCPSIDYLKSIQGFLKYFTNKRQMDTHTNKDKTILPFYLKYTRFKTFLKIFSTGFHKILFEMRELILENPDNWWHHQDGVRVEEFGTRRDDSRSQDRFWICLCVHSPKDRIKTHYWDNFFEQLDCPSET